MIAVLAGSTGLVGGYVKRLAGDGCLALVRRNPGPGDRLVDYGNLEASLGDQLRPQRIYCALGTTIRKAGSQAAFRQVDFEYPMALARWAKLQGCTDFRLVSSVGADSHSSNFYLKTKGELEDALAALNFAQLQIFRPGVLLGHRQESRPGESIGKALSVLLGPLLIGGLAKYRATPAEAVARAMVQAPASNGVKLWHTPEILAFADSK